MTKCPLCEEEVMQLPQHIREGECETAEQMTLGDSNA